jgi:hypothetical protein
MKDGSPLKYDNFDFDAEPTSWIKPADFYSRMMDIVKSYVTVSDQQLVKGDMLIITMYINSDTGLITEIKFSFVPYRNGWCRLVPEKFYKIEQALKKDIKFTMTAQGRKFNYNICGVPIIFPK